jgi:hypothetical protein
MNLAPQTYLKAGTNAVTSFTLTGNLPPGISMDAITGALTGAANTGGEFPFTITLNVLYQDGTSASQSTSVEIDVDGLQLSYSNLNVFLTTQPLTPFSYDVAGVSGGLPGDVYSYSIIPNPITTANGNATATPIPVWLHIDPVTGRIYGTAPTSGPTLYSYDLYSVLTTTRDGQNYETLYNFIVYANE